MGHLGLDGLTSITDEQAESLSKVTELYISEDLKPLITTENTTEEIIKQVNSTGIITDEQAEILSNVGYFS